MSEANTFLVLTGFIRESNSCYVSMRLSFWDISALNHYGTRRNARRSLRVSHFERFRHNPPSRSTCVTPTGRTNPHRGHLARGIVAQRGPPPLFVPPITARFLGLVCEIVQDFSNFSIQFQRLFVCDLSTIEVHFANSCRPLSQIYVTERRNTYPSSNVLGATGSNTGLISNQSRRSS